MDSASNASQDPRSFRDVTIDYSQAEGQSLNPAQRAFYKDVLREDNSNLDSAEITGSNQAWVSCLKHINDPNNFGREKTEAKQPDGSLHYNNLLFPWKQMQNPFQKRNTDKAYQEHGFLNLIHHGSHPSNHQSFHFPEKNYTCDQGTHGFNPCTELSVLPNFPDKSFQENGFLNLIHHGSHPPNHQSLHIPEKNYTCDQGTHGLNPCPELSVLPNFPDKSFQENGFLNLIHHGSHPPNHQSLCFPEKNYTCDQGTHGLNPRPELSVLPNFPDKSFQENGSLNIIHHGSHPPNHQSLYFPEKNYSCDQGTQGLNPCPELSVLPHIGIQETSYDNRAYLKSLNEQFNPSQNQICLIGNKEHRCENSNECLVHSSNLIPHQIIHTQEHPEIIKNSRKYLETCSNFTGSGKVEKETYNCTECGKSFKRLSILKRHYRIHTGEKPFKCKDCEKSFNKVSHLRRHHKIHTGEKPFKCQECEKSFKKVSYLKAHQRIHTGEKPFKCKDCEKSFNQVSSLRRHQKIHTGEKPFKCQECEKSFNQISYLKSHQKIHTGEKPFKCQKCEKSFNRVSNLKTHQRIHTGEKPFKCQECEKSFNQISYLKAHQKIHTGEKPFKCQKCEKSFNRVSNLKTHQRIHTGEKPFKCQECGKSFNQISNLKAHQKIHTGGKPFKCQKCEKSFNRVSNLKTHQRIHTGEKPFRCQECKKSFNQISYLKAHQKIHTGEEPFKCQECEKSFNKASNLKAHQRIHTGEYPYEYKNIENPSCSVQS